MIKRTLTILLFCVVTNIFAEIKINEILAANEDVLSDNYGEYDDWIEIYNDSNKDLDLKDYYFSDDENELTKWQITSSLLIGAKDYAILWCDNQPEQGINHLGFKLSANGEKIFISDLDLAIIDSVSFKKQKQNVTYGRTSEFCDLWNYFDFPTPRKYNQDFSLEIDSLYVECDPADFEYIYENYSEDFYIPINLTYKNKTWDDVKMRIRGDSSRTYPKKSLKLKFEGEPFINGREKINLNGEYKDKSYLRSIISSIVYKESGSVSFYAKPVKLFLNNEFLGLYMNIENIDEDFLFNWNLNGESNLYKAVLDGSCLYKYDDIFYHWEKKINENGTRLDLKQLIQELNSISDDNYYDEIKEILDYDNMINIIAANILLSAGSTYYHNYYMYNIENNDFWMMFPWDMDRSMSHYGVGMSYQRSSRSNEFDNPIPERALMSDPVKKDIIERIRFISDNIFNLKYLEAKIDILKESLAESVESDNTDEVNDISEFYDAIQREKYFIDNRITFLEEQFKTEPLTFKIFPAKINEKDERIVFSWNKAIDPNNANITYEVIISEQRDFDNQDAVSYSSITDTTLSINYSDDLLGHFWTVRATNNNYEISGYNKINLIEKETITSKIDYNVFSYPNPFYDEVNILLKNQSNLISKVMIYNVKGKKIRELNVKKHENDYDCFIWNGELKNAKKASSGIYLFKAIVGNKSFYGKITMMK